MSVEAGGARLPARAGRRHLGQLRRRATDPATPFVVLLLAAVAAALADRTALSWGAMAALAGYSLSGSV